MKRGGGSFEASSADSTALERRVASQLLLKTEAACNRDLPAVLIADHPWFTLPTDVDIYLRDSQSPSTSDGRLYCNENSELGVEPNFGSS
jgi:hypothetical protein